MALSNTYYNNNYDYDYYPLQTPNNSQFFTFHDQPSYLDETFFLQTPYVDPTSTLDEINNYPPLFHSSLDDIFQTQEQHYKSNFNYDYNYDYLPCPKRQRYCYVEEEDNMSSSLMQDVTSFNYSLDDSLLSPNRLDELLFNPNQLDELLLNPNLDSNLNPSSMQGEVAPFFGVQDFSMGSNEGIVNLQHCEKKGHNEKNTISTQSIAARERRRKITEKTQELGKLVPGGPKMNTAEMLTAAAKYVKYLQSQVGMFQLMNETLIKEDKEAPPNEDLHKLVISPFVQEKLYSEEKCFVPKEFVTTLTNNDDVRSKPKILEDLKQLIETDTEKKQKQEL